MSLEVFRMGREVAPEFRNGFLGVAVSEISKPKLATERGILRLQPTNILELLNGFTSFVGGEQHTCQITACRGIVRVKLYSQAQFPVPVNGIAFIAIRSTQSIMCGGPLRSDLQGFGELVYGCC